MFNMQEIIRLMAANAEAMRALLRTIPAEQAQWKPSPDTWSLQETMAHVYNEERGDFRTHLKEMLSDPPQPWGAFRQAPVRVDNCPQALEGFLSERAASIAWLQTLQAPAWDGKVQVSFGPSNERMTLSAGDVLVSWVEHDILHLRQIIELLHAWNVQQASPYSLEYAGGW